MIEKQLNNQYISKRRLRNGLQNRSKANFALLLLDIIKNFATLIVLMYYPIQIPR